MGLNRRIYQGKTGGSKLLLETKMLMIFAFSCLLGLEVWAQSLDNTKEMAAVYPEKEDLVGVATPGVPVFTDQGYVFGELPDFLEGKGYLLGSMSKGSRVVPVTTGLLFIVTPLEGESGSQAKRLEAQGFTKIEQPSFSLFQEQEEAIGIFTKAFEYTRFRLEDVLYDGWAVAFFDPEPLPSMEEPARIEWLPGAAYAVETRQWQGCPSITQTGKRLWGAWFSGGTREPDAGNYGIISYQDVGADWVDPALVITHPDQRVRVMDPQLWTDPNGSLWIFWVQNTGQKGFDGIWGTWAVRIDNPEADRPEWTSPKRLSDGLTRNKPIVLSSGEWLLPSYDWINHQSAVYASDDEGESWIIRGGPLNKPVSNFYEHMCVQLKDDRIWMLQRNIQQSISTDNGANWTPLERIDEITSANSRVFIGRLQSGNLLLVYNNDPERKNLTAFLSEDDGKTWPHALLLDERDEVSYPDMVQNEEGLIQVCYDRSRTGEKEILMAKFTEQDIVNGSFESSQAVKKEVISKVPD